MNFYFQFGSGGIATPNPSANLDVKFRGHHTEFLEFRGHHTQFMLKSPMPRLARAVAAQIPHHITQRGNRRQQTFFCEEDFRLYIRLLKM